MKSKYEERSKFMDNGASSYRRFLDGDDKALAEIVKDYSDGLTLYLNGIVDNISVAEELMEETMFKIITKKPRFNAKCSFKTWLYTIGRNVAIDYLRHNAKRSDTSFNDMENYIHDEQDLERLYIIEEQKISVHRALKKLPCHKPIPRRATRHKQQIGIIVLFITFLLYLCSVSY